MRASERETLVVEEDGSSRTTFDMECIPVPRKTNILGISSLMHRLESHLVIKVFPCSVGPITLDFMEKNSDKSR